MLHLHYKYIVNDIHKDILSPVSNIASIPCSKKTYYYNRDTSAVM